MTATRAAPDVDIVPVGPEQAASLAPIHAASFAEAWSEAALTRLLRADAARAFGAYADHGKTPAGFVLAFVAADEAEILTIAVPERYRRHGIGTRLLRALQATLAEAGIVRLYLEVAADNSAAYGLYRRHGFVEMGRRKSYYQRSGATAVDALVLSVTLTPAQTSSTPEGSPTVG